MKASKFTEAQKAFILKHVDWAMAEVVLLKAECLA